MALSPAISMTTEASEKKNVRSSFSMLEEGTAPIFIVRSQPPTSPRSGSIKRSDVEYPGALKLMLITSALCSAVFIVTLDQTIIATAIPKITDEFNSIADVGWYGSAYLLANASFQLSFGRLYTIFSIKWVFLAAISLFEVGSLVCAIASNSVILIVGRAIAGLGCAGCFSGALIIGAHSIPLRYRPIYTGILGAISGLAAICGPILGGFLTDKLSWRWCFYVNLPMGAATIAVIVLLTNPAGPRSSAKNFKERLAKFDVYGTLVFVPCMVCLLLALQWGGIKYPWKSIKIIALFGASLILLITFIQIQAWKKENATLPPRIIKQRSVAASAWYACFVGAAFFIVVYYLPIWFQVIKNASAVNSGIMNLPTVIGVVVMSVIAGGMVTAWGYYTPFMIAGSILMAIGGGLLTTFHVDTGHPKWIGYQALFGFGLGLGMQQPLMAVQTVLDLADVSTGTAVVVFAQTIGGSVFLLVAENIFSNKLLHYLQNGVPTLNPSLVLGTGATELRANIPAQNLPGVLIAYNSAISDTFYIAVTMGSLSILGALSMEWKSVKGRKLDVLASP